MNLDPFPFVPETLSVPTGLCRSEDFGDVDTLVDLLVRLGHECRGRCPDESFSLDGLIYVIPRRQLPGSVALVLIDLRQRPEPLVELLRVMRAFNSCARLDRIRVVPADGGSE